jgi:hypothetical protein
MTLDALRHSRALWNRNALDLRSKEILVQLLERGELAAWRELYLLAKEDPELRKRLVDVVMTVPLPMPHFWLALLKNLGEPVDVGARLPDYASQGV